MSKVTATRSGRTTKGTGQTKPGKVFIYALALVALSGGTYLVYDNIRRKRENISEADSDAVPSDNNVSYNATSVAAPIAHSSSVKGTDNFPLKNGSRGAAVTILQQALAKKLGDPAFKSYGGIDGRFGTGTLKALKKLGYQETVDQSAFDKITGKDSSLVKVVFNPGVIASTMYKAGEAKDLNTVLTQLKQIRAVSDYSSVNEYYKKQSFIGKTIVTHLLDYAFKDDETAKDRIKDEFFRIGLKLDISGKWSLQGIPLYKDLITLRQTLVIDAASNRIPVRKNTILGEEVKVENGMTWFRSLDNNILQVPTRDVKSNEN